jgi:hypothetical protein
MASYYGVIILVIGLSLLLGFAGIATGAGKLIDTFFNFGSTEYGAYNVTNYTSNLATTTGGASSGDEYFTWLYSLLGLSAAIGLGVGVLSRDIAQGMKAGIASVFEVWLITDIWAILTFSKSEVLFGGFVSFIALIIYVPLLIGSIISMASWIGGSSQ